MSDPVSSMFSRRQVLRSSALLLALQATRPRGSLLLAAPPCPALARTLYPPLLEKLIAKLDPAADDFPTEIYAAEIEKVLDAWSDGLCAAVHDAQPFHVSNRISASPLHTPRVTPLRDHGPLRIERRTFDGPDLIGREAVLKSWASYVSAFSKLHVAEFELFGIRVVSESPLRVATDIRCDLVGTAKDGAREQRVGTCSLSWERDDQKRWAVTRWIANPEVRSRLTGPGFQDITSHCIDATSPGAKQLSQGIDDYRSSLDGACGIDVYGNHGIAVGDIDGSGFDSFYVCQPSGLPNRLYRNRGDGTFEDITAISGTGILDGTASAIFADFLNRGKQDLLVVRSGGPLFFTNLGEGRFEPRPDAFHFARPPQGTFTSAAVADYNKDGLLDIYFCVYSYYQGLNQYQFPSPYYDAQNGPPNFLFRNRGDGTFEDVTAPSGMDQNNNRFSFAAAWCDYDGDGRPDLYVANDFGRKNLYKANGDGTFSDVAKQAGVEDYGPGMSVCWLDVENDGKQDVYVANMWLKEGKRITANERFLAGAPADVRALYQKHNAGNSMYRNKGNGAFEDRTLECGAAMARWSWSCASWDFEHDGFADLYVANGFVSGPNHFDLQSFFWRQVAQRSLGAGGQEYEMAWNAVNELIRADYSWSGHQRNVFYANNGDGTFSDVSGVLGLDLRDDSRAYALSDFDHDGRSEFVLKNRTAPQLRIMRNDMRDLGNSVTVRLTGHTSNRDAIGAEVTIAAGPMRQTKFVSAGSGFASQHTKELHFGLGAQTQPVSLSVRWPTGVVERHEGVPVNHRVAIEEGVTEFRAEPYRKSKEGAAAPLAPPVAESSAATWLIAPVFGPDVTLPTGPALLTFVQAGCGDSAKQLELLASKTSLRSIVVAAGSAAGDRTIGAWNVFYRYLFDRRRDMTLPISFLLDAEGAVVRIYHGVVDPAVCAADAAATNDGLARAMPFPGPYYGNPMSHNYFTDGVAFVEYGYVEEAQRAFQRVVDKDPSHAGAWFNLGTIYLGKKMYPEARQSLEKSVQLNAEDADAWNNLGMISGEEGNLDRALEEFQKAARANPDHQLAVQNMMRIYQYQGRAADAQRMLEELVTKAPGNPGLHLALGMALVGQNQLDRGREELETSVRLNPANPDALNDLGAVLMRMGRAADALAIFDKCRSLAPDFDRPFLNTAILYNRAGQPDKARAVLKEFLARHPDNTDVQSALAKTSGN